MPPAPTAFTGLDVLTHAKVNLPLTISGSVDEEEYMTKIEGLAYKAFEDQCTTTNPRLQKVVELNPIC